MVNARSSTGPAVRARGMTLIEVMVALVVSIIGLFGTLAVITTTFKGSDFSRRTTEASVLVQDKLESLMATQVTLTSPANNATGCPTPTYAQGLVDSTSLNGLGQVTATPPIYARYYAWCTTADGLRRRVTVWVTWTDASNRAHVVTASRDRTP
jgi:prepilin-type N-terminal cleavage/methylation domain-containing protein